MDKEIKKLTARIEKLEDIIKLQTQSAYHQADFCHVNRTRWLGDNSPEPFCSCRSAEWIDKAMKL